MGAFFRSEEMGLYQLFLHSEEAFECILELGTLGLVQFRDLNVDVNVYHRRFVNEVRRCSEIEHTLRLLDKEIDKAGIPRMEPNLAALPRPSEMMELELTVTNVSNELSEENETIMALKKNLSELTELKYVLHKTNTFFEEDGECSSTESMSSVLIKEEPLRHTDIQLSFLTGVIKRDRIPGFERMLWRAFRGNVLLRLKEIETPLEDPSTGHLLNKSVFMILFHDKLRNSVQKICDGFHATIYNPPASPSDRREIALSVLTKIQDLDLVLGKTYAQRSMVILSAAKHINEWFVKVVKMKAIYFTFNLFNQDITHKCLIGECWIPVNDVDQVKDALKRGMNHSESSVPPVLNRIDTTDDPPTYNRTNKFTSGFQTLIDAYGVANYREVSPTPFTLVTFPFLFAVMFGDLGHGLIVTLFSGWMVLKEKTLIKKNIDVDIWRIVFDGRYVILLMGLFSIYTGFVYNDLFSKSMNIFGSHWNSSASVEYMRTAKYIKLNPDSDYGLTPYPVGMDPVWHLANNRVGFLNAYKMKISIIIGVIHMILGVSLSVFNYTYFKRKCNIFTRFLPEMIFLICLFFYLVVLIFIKWVIYAAGNPPETSPGCAPSILVTFINMMLLTPGSAVKPCSPWMYDGQLYVQYMLLATALICVPWLLIAGPVLKLVKQKNQQKLDEVHEDMTDVCIHQAIHTIEYVLGSVSHTASYLRLWALSLAHSQLTDVLWTMVLAKALRCNSLLGGLMLYLVFPLWAVLTIAILVLMEGLSAFLHTLRLHWVEFQSKFYTGDGHAFLPFSFEAILEEAIQSRKEKF